jgi:hypothetical protein
VKADVFKRRDAGKPNWLNLSYWRKFKKARSATI